MSEPAEYTALHAHEALVREAGELELDVSINGEHVVVRGTVATAERRERVTEILRGCCEGREVRNEVEVASLAPSEEPERLT